MEKQNAPIGGFRVVCLLKNELLPGDTLPFSVEPLSPILECVGTGVTIVGETRRLIVSLPQDLTDLFTDRFTFGMMEESCRLKFDCCSYTIVSFLVFFQSTCWKESRMLLLILKYFFWVMD